MPTPLYPPLSGNPLFLNGGVYNGLAQYPGVPYLFYPPITTILVVPVNRRWPRPLPGTNYPIHSVPPGLATIIGGHRYPVGVQQPVGSIGGVHVLPSSRPVAPVRPAITPHPAVVARPSMGGVHAIGHR